MCPYLIKGSWWIPSSHWLLLIILIWGSPDLRTFWLLKSLSFLSASVTACLHDTLLAINTWIIATATEACSVTMSALIFYVSILLFKRENTNKQEKRRRRERRLLTTQKKTRSDERRWVKLKEWDSLKEPINSDLLIVFLNFYSESSKGHQGDRNSDPLSLKMTSKTGLTEPVKQNSKESIWGQVYARLTFRLERNWNVPQRWRERGICLQLLVSLSEHQLRGIVLLLIVKVMTSPISEQQIALDQVLMTQYIMHYITLIGLSTQFWVPSDTKTTTLTCYNHNPAVINAQKWNNTT